MTQGLLALIVAPAVLGFVALCLREPTRVALPVYAALIPFGGLLSVGSSRFGSLSSLTGFVLGAGLVLQFVSARRSAVRLYPTLAAWLLFLGLAGATVLWSITPATTVSGLFVLSSLVLVYVFVSLSHVDRVVLRRTENGLLIGAVVATGYGLVQLLFLGGLPSDVAGEPPGPYGRFGNGMLGPDNEAVSLLLPLAIALSRTVTLPTRGKRILHAGLSVVVLAGLVMTGSRGGLLATVVTVVTLTLLTPRGGRKKLATYGAIGLTLAALVWIYQPSGVTSRTYASTASSSGRTSIWQVGLAACSEYCASGSGWGTFPDVYAETQASVPGARVLVGQGGSYQPHNLWLLAAIETGLTGLALLVTGLLLAIREGLRLPKSLRGPPVSALLGTIFAANFLSNLEFKFFWMALIAVALCRNMTDAEADAPVRGRELAALTPARPPSGRPPGSP